MSICLRVGTTSEFFINNTWLIWTLAVVAGACHGIQAAAADYYRNFHLFFLKGKEGSELDTASVVRAHYRALPWKGNIWKKLTLFFYANYTENQEKRTPHMQTLRGELKARFGENIPQNFRDAFRAKSKPLMKYTNMLSFNTRVIALFVSLFLQMPWLYFAFELTVLNLMLVYMIARHERICKNFTKELKDGKY